MKKTITSILLILFVLYANSIFSQTKIKSVYVFKIDEEIAAPAVRITENALKEAKELKSDLIILHLNTFGGQLDAAEKIRTFILESKIPVWAYINNNAASAGALISLSCDSIYMHSGASIGAASVVNQNGELMPDKYQSYMRSIMRATAEMKNRNPKIAEAMVDPRVKIENVNDSGKVLTFTTDEAIKNNYCEGKAESVEQVLKITNIEDYSIKYQEISWLDKFIGFLINPFISGILIMLIIGGIYFEMQSPGIGFALLVAIVAALLYFAPLYLEGLAASWEIIIFIVGLILLAIEIFVIPGFGVAGISGIILIISGLTLSLIKNQGFDFSYPSINNIAQSLFVVACSITGSFFASLWLGQKLFTTTRFGEFALNSTQKSSEGFNSIDSKMVELVGQKCVAYTMLRPSGKIMINKQTYDATAETGYIDKGQNVKIVRFENHQLIVRID